MVKMQEMVDALAKTMPVNSDRIDALGNEIQMLSVAVTELSSQSPSRDDAKKEEARKKQQEVQRVARKRSASAVAAGPSLSEVPKKPITQLTVPTPTPAVVPPTPTNVPKLKWHLVPKKFQPEALKLMLKSHQAAGRLSRKDDDGDVPKDCIQDWEELKEMFIKWYYGFSRLPKDVDTASEVWKIFLYTYPKEEVVEKMRQLVKEGKLNLDKVIPRSIICPPRQFGYPDLSVPLFELGVVAGIHGLTKEKDPEEYMKLAEDIYGLYGYKPDV